MANKTQLSVTYGSSPGTISDGVTGIDIITGDNATNTSANRIQFPIRIPTSGSSYSYEKYLRLKCISAPDTQISSIKMWTASTLDTGLALYIKTASGYSTPTVPSGVTGYSRFDSVYTASGSAFSIGGTLTASGDYSDYAVLLLKVDSTATSGSVTQIDISYSYEEQ